MDSKKYEKLIELIINEQEEAAKALLHDIVVEKSREIYESIMEMDDDRDMGGQVGDLLDEITDEAEGMNEADEELDVEVDAESPEGDMDAEMDMDADMGADAEMDADMGDDSGIEDGEVLDFDAAEGEDDVKDMLADIEDKLESQDEKLSRLLDEFEKKLNGDMADEDEAEAEADEADAEADEEAAADDEEKAEEKLAEAKLTPVRVPHNPTDSAKSPSLTKPGAVASGKGHPVRFSDSGSVAGKLATAKQSGKSYQNAGAGHGVRQTPAPKPMMKPAAGSDSGSPIRGGVKR